MQLCDHWYPTPLCRRVSDLQHVYAVVAVRKDPSAAAIRAQMRYVSARLARLTCAATASAKASANPAGEFRRQFQQQGASAAEQEGSRRFTHAQRAVAVALMEVMQEAMRDSKEAAMAARLTLTNDNPAMRPFLAMMPENGPVPTVKQLEQRASDQLLESLTKLANQCAAAQCQPLEVFTRSMQSRVHMAAANSIAAMRGWYEQHRQSWQQQQL